MKTIAALALMVFSAGAFAQINKCVDPSGKVVGYGQCPPGTRSEASGVRSSPAPAPAPSKSGAAAAAGPKTAAEKDADFRKRQIEKQEADAKDAKKAAVAEQNKQACEESRAYLTSLKSGNRIQKSDPKTGERIYLQDNEYAGEIARTEQKIKNWCK
jgi:hypothetical protein